MKVGDLVELTLSGKVVIGMRYYNGNECNTGVFLGWARGSEHIATIYWLDGVGYKEVHKKYFQKKT